MSEAGPAYRARIVEVARWSEAAGCAGTLVYTDNRLVDPWLTAQLILQSTERLAPLVAVQPAYMHPYTVAKTVASLGYFHGRKICLNMVAGGFKRDLEALDDFTEHDERYDRLVEYATIVKALLEMSSRNAPFTFRGTYYVVTGLKLTPPLPSELMPELFVSGSSDAGLAAAAAIGATAVQYPQPAGNYVGRPVDPDLACGLRVGIITRATSAEAWRVAEERFPPDRRGQIAHTMAMKTSDSHWHHDLSERPAAADDPESPYWLRPFRNYKTFCPYLVGSYDRVTQEVRRYLAAGFRSIILDIPTDETELRLTREVLDAAGYREAA